MADLSVSVSDKAMTSGNVGGDKDYNAVALLNTEGGGVPEIIWWKPVVPGKLSRLEGVELKCRKQK